MPRSRIISTLLFCLFLATTSAQAYEHCKSIANGLDTLVSRVNPNVKVGLVVQSLSTGHIYYSKNSDHYF